MRTKARSARPIDGQQRDQLRHGADEVRGVARHQDSAFDGAAPGDSDVAGGQIAQTAVHQLGAPPAGAEGQVVLLDQRDRSPRDAASSAMPVPVMPPPITMTSIAARRRPARPARRLRRGMR